MTETIDTPKPDLIPNPATKQRRTKLLLGLAGIVVASALSASAYWVFYGSHFVSTDNAYAAVEIAQITPSISGTIGEVW